MIRIENKCIICGASGTNNDHLRLVCKDAMERGKIQKPHYACPEINFCNDCFNIASPKLSGGYIQGRDLEETKECIVCETEIPIGENYILPEITMTLDNKSTNGYGIPDMIYPYEDYRCGDSIILNLSLYDIGICQKCSEGKIKMLNYYYPIHPFFGKKLPSNPFFVSYTQIYPDIKETPKRIKLKLKQLQFPDKVKGLSPKYQKFLPEIKNKYTNELNNLIGDLKNIVDNIIQEFKAKKDGVTWEEHWETSIKEIHEKVADIQKRCNLEVEELLERREE